MKQLIRLGMLSPLLVNTSIFAMNPIQGFYGGLLAEVSHGPSNAPVYFIEDNQLFNGTVKYSPVSGGAGIMIGYKYLHFRAEGEFLYNRISTGPVTVGTCTIQNKDVLTPTGVCTAGTYDHFQEQALGYSGYSTAMYGLVNMLWDFYSENSGNYVAPYLGVGIGGASIKNNNNFVNTTNQSSNGQTISSSGPAIQGILGISYYMDDFTWASADYRYLTANRKANNDYNIGENLPSQKYTLNTINFTINFSFDRGKS